MAVEAEVRNRQQLAAAGSAVREARVRRHLTQEALSRRAGLSRMSISRAERGLEGGDEAADRLQCVAESASEALGRRGKRHPDALDHGIAQQRVADALGDARAQP